MTFEYSFFDVRVRFLQLYGISRLGAWVLAEFLKRPLLHKNPGTPKIVKNTCFWDPGGGGQFATTRDTSCASLGGSRLGPFSNGTDLSSY
jgi:hypothetical protein